MRRGAPIPAGRALLAALALLARAGTPADVLPGVDEQLLLTRCPNDCSFQGYCIRDECVCNVGFDGPDCSHSVMAYVNFGIRSFYPPTGSSRGGTLVRISGFNFANATTMACRFALGRRDDRRRPVGRQQRVGARPRRVRRYARQRVAESRAAREVGAAAAE